jgi:HlyD family secretion protein
MILRWMQSKKAWLGAGLALSVLGSIGAAILVSMAGCSQQKSAAQAPAGKSNAASVRPAGGSSEPVARVKIVLPRREHLKRVSTPQPARVAPYEQTEIHAKVSGYLHLIAPVRGSDGQAPSNREGRPRPLDIGDRVTKGQALAELSIPEMKQELVQKAALVAKARAEVGQAKAAVETAQALVAAAGAKAQEAPAMLAKYEADVAFHRFEHARYEQLIKDMVLQADLAEQELKKLRAAEAHLAAAKHVVATAQANVRVEEARRLQTGADLESAKARLSVAEADLKHAEIMADYAVIRAPYDGVLTRRFVDTGAFIQAATTGKGTPLFTLARVDRLRIVADIPEAEAGLVNIGQPATFELTALGGQSLPGKVVRFADALDSDSRTMRLEVELDAPTTKVRPGMFGSLTITLVDLPDALTLPATALTAGNPPAVWCVESGQVHRRPLEVGYSDGVRFQVVKGLTAESHVIADGKSSFRDGQAVEIANR